MGLCISGMCRISKVLGFLSLDGNWDGTLAVVLLTAVGINLITFHFIMKNRSISAPSASAPVDLRLIIGAAIFGAGWGFCGLCPGPAMILFVAKPSTLYFFFAMVLGQVIHDYDFCSINNDGAKESLIQ